MPSGGFSGGGSHSGGGGHSSGGGFHSGGGGSGSSSFPRGRIGGRTVVFIGGTYHGRRRYVNEGIFSLISFLLVFSIVCLFFGTILGFVAGNTQGVKDSYQRDYDFFQNMITVAEENPDYMLEIEDENHATVTAIRMGDGVDKYYLNYRFRTAYSSTFYSAKSVYESGKGWYEWVEGYTYTIYTLDDIKSIHVGDPIKLALDTNKNNITPETNSIDYKYKDTTLEDDADFMKQYSGAKTFRVIGIIVLLVSGVCIVAMVILFVKNIKKEDEQSVETPRTVEEPRKKLYKCRYCGATLKPDTYRCDNCGASLTEEDFK